MFKMPLSLSALEPTNRSAEFHPVLKILGYGKIPGEKLTSCGRWAVILAPWKPGSCSEGFECSLGSGSAVTEDGWNFESGGDRVLCTWLAVQASPLNSSVWGPRQAWDLKGR